MSSCLRIYESWTNETAALTDAEKGRLIDSLVAFISTGKEQPPTGNERFIYPLMIGRVRRELDTHERKKAERKENRAK